MLGKPEVWTGVVSGAQASRSTSYSGTGSGFSASGSGGTISFGNSNRYGSRGSASTTHHVNLLLDGRPVLFSSREPGVLRDGDQAILGGVVKNGTLKASAYRNLTNGASHKAQSTLVMVLGIIFIVVGVPFILVLGAGLIFIGIGIFLVVLANHYNRINRLVAEATASPATPRNAPPPEAPAPAAPIVS